MIIIYILIYFDILWCIRGYYLLKIKRKMENLNGLDGWGLMHDLCVVIGFFFFFGEACVLIVVRQSCSS